MYMLTHSLQEEKGAVMSEALLTSHWAGTQLSSSHSVIFSAPQKRCLHHSYDEKTPKQLLRYQEC